MNNDEFTTYLESYRNHVTNISKEDFSEIINNIDYNYNKIMRNKKEKYQRQYKRQQEKWKQHQRYWYNNYNVMNVNIVEKKEIHINVSTIINISSLLKIINENEFQENTLYNFDLKALHNIKDELILINDMIGMTDLKSQLVDQLLYFIQYLHKSKNSDFLHTVISGPPGTGKTEIAKLIGTMYSKLGILHNKKFKKVTRSDLIAGFLGQTAIKTNDVISECLGGVLFIDEVYSLGPSSGSNSDSFSKECIDTLCESLSNHKDNLMVIVAGYEEEINESFFSVNQGLSSRFIWRFNIDGYNANEMMQIFCKKIKDNDWLYVETDITSQWFEKKKETFKNYGRDMEILFSYTKICHGRRIFGKLNEIMKQLTINDLNNGYEMYLKNKKSSNKEILYGLYV
jgi:SpoVK/Ycf46/Vps4 family AAA+-type ATPase